jgi:hypothetical protein
MWNPLTDFVPPDSVAFYSGTGGISVYPFKNFPPEQISITLWVNTDSLQSAGTLVSYVAGPMEETFTLQESEMDARDLMIWIGGHGQRTGVQIADGNWHFIAVTWSSFDGATFLFVDGLLMFSTIMAKGVALGDGGSLMFGQDQRIDNGWCCSSLPNRAFTGQLADIALWNKPLGLDDLRAQIDNQQERDVTGLIMRLKFKEQTKAIRDRGVALWEKVVPDLSGFHHDAVRVGIPLPTLMHRKKGGQPLPENDAPPPPENAATSQNNHTDGAGVSTDDVSTDHVSTEDVGRKEERKEDRNEERDRARDRSQEKGGGRERGQRDWSRDREANTQMDSRRPHLQTGGRETQFEERARANREREEKIGRFEPRGS